MFDRASPYKSVFKVLHERTMDFIDKALNSSIIASQNNRFIIIGQLSFWLSAGMHILCVISSKILT